MALTAAAAAAAGDTVTTVPLTAHEALSGILGSISIACWIFLLIPQLLENHRNASATALSLPFLFIWFLGDVCNLAGAAWAGLVPTVIAIAVYFCLADGVLIGQCGWYYYYNDKNKNKTAIEGDAGADAMKGKMGFGGNRRSAALDGMGGGEDQQQQHDVGEEEPLLARQRSGSITIPGSGKRMRRRRTGSSSAGTGGGGGGATTTTAAARRRSSQGDHLLVEIAEEEGAGKGGARGKEWVKNLISLLAIIAVGTAGWAIAWASGAWRPTTTVAMAIDGADSGGETGPIGAQVLGYASALAYLGARIPQIVKNARDRSCEGLSLLFFILSLMGNLTYGAGIIFHSLDRDYLVTNVPWLIGSLGTMVEDVIIFVQFHMYARVGGVDDDDNDDEAVIV